MYSNVVSYYCWQVFPQIATYTSRNHPQTIACVCGSKYRVEREPMCLWLQHSVSLVFSFFSHFIQYIPSRIPAAGLQHRQKKKTTAASTEKSTSRCLSGTDQWFPVCSLLRHKGKTLHSEAWRAGSLQTVIGLGLVHMGQCRQRQYMSAVWEF